MLRSLSFALLLCAAPVVAQQPGALPTDTVKAKPVAPKKPWYETFSIRGYGQVRYNRLLETNDQLKCEQCDRSWGDNGGFFIRRARIIFSGYVHPRVYIYLQPDFASSAGTTAPSTMPMMKRMFTSNAARTCWMSDQPAKGIAWRSGAAGAMNGLPK